MTAIICPHCQTPLSQDFGVVTCSNCGAVVMIDMNGEAKLAASEPSPAAPLSQPNLSPESAAPFSGDVIDPSSPFLGLDLLPEIPKSAFQEIEEFGNQDLHSGPLLYELRIEGLDNGELKTKMREILSDSRLNLNAPQVMSSIVHGKLELAALNPVKVTYVVSRLRHLPLKISWRQSAFQN